MIFRTRLLLLFAVAVRASVGGVVSLVAVATAPGLAEVRGVAPRVRPWLGPGIGKTGEWMLDKVWLETRP
jgi:hypothetical protein